MDTDVYRRINWNIIEENIGDVKINMLYIIAILDILTSLKYAKIKELREQQIAKYAKKRDSSIRQASAKITEFEVSI